VDKSRPRFTHRISDNSALPGSANIASRILLIRGRKVMIDADLAALYGMSTKRLNEQVGHNASRFPADFMY
jgi:hypothetical protein